MIAACLVYNRPKYFSQVLPSLLENDVEWWFFVDGPKTVEVKECLAMLKGLNVETSNVNLGIGKNKQRAHRLFEEHEQVLFFEDDMIISPYYVNVLLKLQEQFPDCVVGAPDDSKREPPGRNYLCSRGLSQLWGYSMRREIFKGIESDFNSYIIDTGDDYRKRPHNFLKEKYSLRLSSHDSAITTFTIKSEYSMMHTVVPRGKYIGARGVHFSPESFSRRKFPNPNEYIFESDKNPGEFYEDILHQ
jgi:glycosyltransferase involved in cell wall biosynthesis